jgi:hypothetical protein
MYEYFSLCRLAFVAHNTRFPSPDLDKIEIVGKVLASRVTIGYFFISVGTVGCARLKKVQKSYHIIKKSNVRMPFFVMFVNVVLCVD